MKFVLFVYFVSFLVSFSSLKIYLVLILQNPVISHIASDMNVCMIRVRSVSDTLSDISEYSDTSETPPKMLLIFF
jgi:hypothetical protein